MGLPMNIQYLGFEQRLNRRTYAFRVIETLKPDREFQLSVDMHSLTANKFKLQDIPDLCFAKLKRDLGAETLGEAVPLRRRLSDFDLQQYIASHYQKEKRA